MSKNNPIHWYNIAAPLYDLSVKGVYTRARLETMRQLNLKTGQVVLDVACGTGENFSYLLDKIGPTGIIIGTDFSEGMLEQACKKIKKHGWENVSVLHTDARRLTLDMVRKALSAPELSLDAVLCTLGLSVVPEWETAFAATWNMLAKGGYYAIMDWYVPRSTLWTKLINLIAASDIHRNTPATLAAYTQDFQHTTFFRGQVFVASGRKPL